MSDGFWVENASGVTVLDVVKSCVEKWSSAPPFWIAEDIAETMSSWCETKVEDVIWEDTLFDRRFYEGMREAVGVREGVVKLVAHSFGS